MADLVIEPAVQGQLQQIKALLQSCQLPEGDINPAHLTHFRVAKQEGTIVAVVGLEPLGETGLLRSLAVVGDYRSGGLGSRMVAHIEEYARQKGIWVLFLLTTTAAEFFSRLGYEVVERANAPIVIQETQEFKEICPDSAICMQKRLIDD